ncbi:MAG: anthranilate phosphoribosyltransferase, partial [Bdellovibrionales bacterium]|nr:anthranilate phosphoribosyltransferase [Bdellovibrionales bacterium]
MSQVKLKPYLELMLSGKQLSRSEARTILRSIASGEQDSIQVSAFLTVLRMRPVSSEELAGFRDAMLELCHLVDLGEYDPIDPCGTGGDGKNTFNISTLVGFVLAGAGVKVAKHGNYSNASACGSSNILEHFGIKFRSKKEDLVADLEESNFCYLHAPLFHPAMKNVATIRKSLGIQTIFNMLGPLVNPVRPQKQFVGVFSAAVARLYAELYRTEKMDFTIVHSLDGYDEISLTSDFIMININGEKRLDPTVLGFAKVSPESLAGGEDTA